MMAIKRPIERPASGDDGDRGNWFSIHTAAVSIARMKDSHSFGLNAVTSFVWFLFTTRREGSLNPCKLGT